MEWINENMATVLVVLTIALPILFVTAQRLAKKTATDLDDKVLDAVAREVEKKIRKDITGDGKVG